MIIRIKYGKINILSLILRLIRRLNLRLILGLILLIINIYLHLIIRRKHKLSIRFRLPIIFQFNTSANCLFLISNISNLLNKLWYRSTLISIYYLLINKIILIFHIIILRHSLLFITNLINRFYINMSCLLNLTYILSLYSLNLWNLFIQHFLIILVDIFFISTYYTLKLDIIDIFILLDVLSVKIMDVHVDMIECIYLRGCSWGSYKCYHSN